MASSDSSLAPSSSGSSATPSAESVADDTRIEALITASEVYPALEDMVAKAEDEVLLCFRVFDPATRLRREELRERGLDTWLDLLDWVSDRGVAIRLVITDFDPLFASDLHRLSWQSASRFANQVEGDVQILIAPHGQEVGWVWRRALIFKIAQKLKQLKTSREDRLTPVQRKLLKSRPFLRPVSLHQKIAVIDGKRALVGGLDVDERRWDDNDHDRPAEETWHDVSMTVEGPFAGAVRSHFVDTWNSALDDEAASVADDAQRMEVTTRVQGTGNLRFIRTMSAPNPGPFSFGPKPKLTEHEDVTLSAIKAAEHFIYLESQFLRHRPISDALAAAARRVPDLQLIVLLPPEPERILFGGTDSWDARHAHALQTLSLNDLRTAYQDRVALLSPGQTRSVPEGFNGALGGAGPIYVHAKVTLIDDNFGLVGSANLNGRSMRWDTEASIMFRDQDLIRNLRLRLAKKWLGAHLGDQDPTRAQVWTEAARANAERRPEDRDGFVMPYPLGRARRFSRHLPLLPDEMF